jgi:hypothetical protein
MRFDGRLLRRGFWLYVWDIRSVGNRVLYVGRTGDSSSANASSPFSRIGQHLNFRENAKANSMARRLAQAGVDPECCEFSMVAIGPLFPEQVDFDAHAKVRDRVSALEAALAQHLRARGYSVLGIHSSRATLDAVLWGQVAISIDSEFPPLDASPVAT